ncbi:uncharacterized protein KIAA1671-like [Pseudoliparis swirei]|uniref:uncharacterized protein KIAA1671-like n=1 Tax=Pseudoliparis swirei TaxID=2059687 RepID=UPI0024BE8282|nr:uncharacterized protein KIAA1671-like [Pseudoliparis swirei]
MVFCDCWLCHVCVSPQSSAPLLDTSAQRSRADLGKRRTRTRPPRSLRGGVALVERWEGSGSTEGKEASWKQRESDSEEEPQPKMVCSPPAMFPGLSPAALIAQIKRKSSGGGTGRGDKAAEDRRRGERRQKEEATQLPRSPRPAHLAGAARVLPPLAVQDGGGAVSSPAWLKELKSRKRLSQYDTEG